MRLLLAAQCLSAMLVLLPRSCSFLVGRFPRLPSLLPLLPLPPPPGARRVLSSSLGMEPVAAADDCSHAAASEIAADRMLTTAIVACGKTRDFKRAIELLNSSRVNAYGLAAAIGVCGKSGQWQKGLELLRQHDAKAGGAVELDEVCFNAALGALEKSGRWQEALELLNEMRDLGVLPTTRRLVRWSSSRTAAPRSD